MVEQHIEPSEVLSAFRLRNGDTKHLQYIWERNIFYQKLSLGNEQQYIYQE